MSKLRLKTAAPFYCTDENSQSPERPAGGFFIWEISMAGETDSKITPHWRIGRDIVTIAVYTSSVLWMAVAGMVVWGGKDAISVGVLIFTTCFALTSIFLLIVIEPIAKKITSNGINIESPKESGTFLKFQAFKLTVLIWCGKLFRTIFIIFIGIAGYSWIDPQPIGDTSLPDLTVRQFFSNMFAFLVALGCIVWFLRFPNNNNPALTSDPTQNSYVLWGAFGIIVVSLGVGITFLAYPVLMILQEATK
jgi:hypothetical protein